MGVGGPPLIHYYMGDGLSEATWLCQRQRPFKSVELAIAYIIFFMNLKYLLLIVLSFVALAEKSPWTLCRIRPNPCPDILRPACGRRRSAASKTYDNECLACSDTDVAAFKAGAC